MDSLFLALSRKRPSPSRIRGALWFRTQSLICCQMWWSLWDFASCYVIVGRKCRRHGTFLSHLLWQEWRMWRRDLFSRRQHASNHTEYHSILCRAVYFVHVKLFFIKIHSYNVDICVQGTFNCGNCYCGSYAGFIHWLRNRLTSFSPVHSSTKYIVHICHWHGLWKRWANSTLFISKPLCKCFCSGRKFPPCDAQLSTCPQTGRGAIDRGEY